MPADWKKQFVKTVENDANKYSVAAVVNFANMPLQQLQSLRQKLRDTVVIRGGRKNLFEKALEGSKDLSKLKEYIQCEQPGMIFSNDNAFSLASTLKKSRTPAPIKSGQKAPKDIIVPAGSTGFSPGPIIGELAEVGIKAGIDAGKVVVKADSLVAKEGDLVSPKLAGVLSRLGVTPMEIGLNLVAAYENGQVFTSKVLDIDEDKYLSDIEQASKWAFNLAMNAEVLTRETSHLLIQKAHLDARAIALAQNILAEGVVDELVAKANAEMQSLKNLANL